MYKNRNFHGLRSVIFMNNNNVTPVKKKKKYVFPSKLIRYKTTCLSEKVPT